MADTDRKPLPPYMPYRTFVTFLDHLKSVGIPSHIDKGAMATMSGAMQSWVKASLRFMGLIDANDVPHDRLKKLVASQGDDRKALLRELFKSTYAFLNGKVDLTNTTAPKLREAITDLGAQGETVEKIMVFMVSMGKDAGIQLSPYLTKRNIGARRARAKVARKDATPNGATTQTPQPDNHATHGAAMKTVILPEANGRLTLSGTFNTFDLSETERKLVFDIIDLMKAFESEQVLDEDDGEEG